MDGLAMTTNFETQPEYGIDNFDKEDLMEISKVEDDKCFYCNEKGHYDRNVGKKTKETALQGRVW